MGNLKNLNFISIKYLCQFYKKNNKWLKKDYWSNEITPVTQKEIEKTLNKIINYSNKNVSISDYTTYCIIAKPNIKLLRKAKYIEIYGNCYKKNNKGYIHTKYGNKINEKDILNVNDEIEYYYC